MVFDNTNVALSPRIDLCVLFLLMAALVKCTVNTYIVRVHVAVDVIRTFYCVYNVTGK